MVSDAPRLRPVDMAGLKHLLVRVLTYRGALHFDLLCDIIRLEHSVAALPADVTLALWHLVRAGTIEKITGSDDRERWRLSSATRWHRAAISVDPP